MLTADLADQLDALAVRLEGRTTGDTTLNSLLLKLVRAPMLEIYAKTLPSSAAAYTTSTANLLTALKVRIPDTPTERWTYDARELWHPGNKPYLVGFEKHIGIGNVNGGTYGVGSTMPLALSAAIARCWAIVVREHLA